MSPLSAPLVASWLWLLAALLPLVLLERWVHRHLQGLWLLVFRDPDIALVVYSLIMLPGVLLHEGSHWLAATFLGVRTGRFSLIPERRRDGTLQLGFVETERADSLREALIGAAPLAAGAAAIIWVGTTRLGVGPVAEALTRGDLLALLQGLQAAARQPDAWLWIYFLFAVSNSMLPSASDRRAWLPVAAAAAAITGALAYFGFGSLLAQAVVPPLDSALRALNFAFSLTVCLDLAIVPLIWMTERLLVRLTGMQVSY